MYTRGFIYLDLISALIITSIFIPILINSALYLLQINHNLDRISTSLIRTINQVNTSTSISNSEPSGVFLTQFSLYENTSYSTPIYWIHQNASY